MCQDRRVPSPVSQTYSNGHGNTPVIVPKAPSATLDLVEAKPDQDSLLTSEAPSARGTPQAGESDEGRHRTHHFYTAVAQVDGLYHCPYEEEETCQHKPTKLKCNYDKFIDSHVKPFRCKVESCATQPFSSTACLLRHEREAHGMHGHGDRPHLCFYHGCERRIPGNGFPRRYNLFDHMKRVHDHKDDPSTSLDSPTMTTHPGIQRRTAGRKRKASDAGAGEPAPQRQKPSPSPANGTMSNITPLQSMPLPHGQKEASPFARGSYSLRKTPEEVEHLQAQWANQRDLLVRQMDSVQSPNDEANLHRLSRNIAELRRLSEEARRG
ncbi:hypothetical protein BAUCODRAFT_394514 [Baudoinia panamericana UAMH 10762]|uniref:C2H2-type domain-containing protein n=1 Tax=Baudoinia panamericana (strain UAMH 10762) TaxID=717646 RepID=M2NIH8_BAUPA|nr:uncharacterized protein BAUCODRAFT_394514 [Baudoinia panamericana UAMH 10762]EMC99194.1 hypothetical protein BAUCODRAFT_394514 [Baudoinia panamericana UAMH 10762]